MRATRRRRLTSCLFPRAPTKPGQGSGGDARQPSTTYRPCGPPSGDGASWAWGQQASRKRSRSCDGEVQHVLRASAGGDLAVALLDLDADSATTEILRGGH